jgi:hypothetical protein
MVRMPVIAAALILPGIAFAQPTDDAAKCRAAAGFLPHRHGRCPPAGMMPHCLLTPTGLPIIAHATGKKSPALRRGSLAGGGARYRTPHRRTGFF